MFNADAIVIKQPQHSMSQLKFVGSRLITTARYLSGWTYPVLNELYRLPVRSYPIAIQPGGGQLLLAHTGRQYELIDTVHGDVVSVCPVTHDLGGILNRYSLSACGGFIIDGVHNAVRVLDLATGAVAWERTFEGLEFAGMWPLRGGSQWALCLGPKPPVEPHKPARIEIWDWPFGAKPRTVVVRDYLPLGNTISDAGLMASPGFGAKPARIFDIETGGAVQEFAAPLGNRGGGHVHWLSGDRLLVAWERLLCVCAIDGSVQRKFYLPRYSTYSADATEDLLALTLHDGFMLIPLDRIPDSQTEIGLSLPWPDPPRSSEPSDNHSFATPEPDYCRTVVAETVTELQEALREFERPAWIPQVSFRAGEITSSKLGGTPFIKQTEEWPHCVVCSRPLELFLQLNSQDLPSEMAHRFSGLLQVFLCVTNGYSTGTCARGYEGFSSASMLRLCESVGQPRYQRPPFEDAFIEGVIESWQRRADLPSLQEVQALGIKLSDRQETLMIDPGERFAGPGEKLGGWPDWPQNVEYVACPRCKQRMDVIFQFGDHGTLPHCFMDGGTAWVSQCAKHPDVLALTWNS
jgi:hypothetical protein